MVRIPVYLHLQHFHPTQEEIANTNPLTHLLIQLRVIWHYKIRIRFKLNESFTSILSHSQHDPKRKNFTDK